MILTIPSTFASWPKARRSSFLELPEHSRQPVTRYVFSKFFYYFAIRDCHFQTLTSFDCIKDHVPGYIENYEQFKKKGIEELICVSANDPYVMSAWGNDLHANGKVRMMADTNGQFCKAADLELDMQKELGNMRCKRFSMLVNDGVVEDFNVEPDGQGLTCTMADCLLKKL